MLNHPFLQKIPEGKLQQSGGETGRLQEAHVADEQHLADNPSHHNNTEGHTGFCGEPVSPERNRRPGRIAHAIHHKKNNSLKKKTAEENPFGVRLFLLPVPPRWDRTSARNRRPAHLFR